MSTPTCRRLWLALPLVFGSLAVHADNASESKPRQFGPGERTVAAQGDNDSTSPSATSPRGSGSAASRPAELQGSAVQALTRLYRIPRSDQPTQESQSRQFGQRSRGDSNTSRHSSASGTSSGTAGRGEAPRAGVSEDNRMGYQHADAIRNSVSEQPIGDPLRQGEIGDHITRAEPSGPAVPRENSLTAYQWSPERDEAYSEEGYAEGEVRDEQAADESAETEAYRFGFVRGYQQGRWERPGAARDYRVLSNAAAQFSRGMEAFRAGNYRTAVKYFKLSSDLNRGDPAAMIYSAHALFAIGRYRESAEFLRKAFALEPRIAMLTYDMRSDYTDREDFERQVRALNNAIANAPRDLDRLVVLGYVLSYSDQPDQAFKVLSKARALNPRDKLVIRLYESTNPPDDVR